MPGRVSIRTKLILGLVLVMTFLAIEGLVATDTVRAVGRLAPDLYDNPLQSLDFARVVQIDVRDLTAARRLAVHPNPALAGPARTGYPRVRQTLDQDLRVARHHAASPAAAAQLAQVRAQLDRWDQLVPPDLIPSANDAKTNEADIEALARDIQTEIDRTAEDARADGLALVKSAREVATEAGSTTLRVSLILILGGLAVSMVLVAAIMRPLRTAIAVSEAITGGDLDHPVRVTRTDEADALLQAMEVMRQRLRAHLEAARHHAGEAIRLEHERAGVITELARTAETAHKRADQALDELQATQARLVEAEAMASLGGLVAGVAHEINSPLGNALGAATHLLHRTRSARALVEAGKLKKSEAEAYFKIADEAAGIISSNLERAADLVHSFKQVAVDQTNDFRRRFDLGTYIDDVLTSLKPRLRKAPQRVTVHCPAGLELDQFPGGLAQVLTNLIINALTHAFDGATAGTIAITARECPPETVELVVADDGCGIPAENIGRIFEPFFTTRRDRGGSGLGLHIVFNIVTQRLGGTISVHSAQGAGTRFVLVFPRIASATAGEAGYDLPYRR
jgi:signal transduction histidine kinase